MQFLNFFYQFQKDIHIHNQIKPKNKKYIAFLRENSNNFFQKVTFFCVTKPRIYFG